MGEKKDKRQKDKDKSSKKFLLSQSSSLFERPVRPQDNTSPDGGIGRRAGLKHQW